MQFWTGPTPETPRQWVLMSRKQALAVGLAKAALDASKKTPATSPAAIFDFFIRQRPRS
jgi:hypothetical protein